MTNPQASQLLNHPTTQPLHQSTSQNQILLEVMNSKKNYFGPIYFPGVVSRLLLILNDY